MTFWSAWARWWGVGGGGLQMQGGIGQENEVMHDLPICLGQVRGRGCRCRVDAGGENGGDAGGQVGLGMVGGMDWRVRGGIVRPQVFKSLHPAPSLPRFLPSPPGCRRRPRWLRSLPGWRAWVWTWKHCCCRRRQRRRRGRMCEQQQWVWIPACSSRCRRWKTGSAYLSVCW